VALQGRRTIGLDERDVADHDVGHAGSRMHGLQPRGLGHLLVQRAPALDMDAADDVEALQRVDVVGRHVIAADLAVVAEEEVGVVLVLLGRVVARAQVPEMVVRIDDRQREIRWRCQRAEEFHLFHPVFSLAR
jgi:hypothetical protein